MSNNIDFISISGDHYMLTNLKTSIDLISDIRSHKVRRENPSS
jgi:hypothetical protein